MSGTRLSSKDFSKVAGVQQPDVVDRLIDHQVFRPRDGQPTDAFSEQRQHFVRAVDLPSRVLSMTMGALEPGQSTRMHRHNYETIIYVVSGEGESLLGDTAVRWRAGDAIYVPVWAWHRHTNTSETASALYVACENAPMLQNLGIALREEA